MIYNEITFFVLFLIPSVFLFHLAGRYWKPWILAAFGSLFFVYYGYLHFGGLWGALLVLLFVWELLTSRLYKKGSLWCAFGIVQAVLILIAFKYLAFFSGALADLSRVLHLPQIPETHRWILPLGISFFTFEFIHFASDVRIGKIRNAALDRYAAFIFFFPTMVAGPIKRYQDFSNQLDSAKFDPEMISKGITRILIGLFKKHVLSDTFVIWANHLQTADLSHSNRALILMWFLSYGMRIYFDFSGYSDIAIGAGSLYGIKVGENFNWPFSSYNISEYWRRWHISLMSWVESYLYRPLVFGNFLSWLPGGVDGFLRLSAISIIIFAISGLWHGAAYNFILWGVFHGFLMSCHLFWKKVCVPRGFSMRPLFARSLTFFSVTMSWGFFCMDLPRALLAYGRLLFIF